MFDLQVTKNLITLAEYEELTSGSAQVYDCIFEFNADWVGLTKKIEFTVDAELSTTPLPVMYVYLDENGMCQIPKEVLYPKWNGHKILVGVCGTRGVDIVLPTIWISLGTLQPAVSGDPGVPGITPDELDAVKEDIGKIEDLTTTDKTSLVGAVNEINEKVEELAEQTIGYELPVASAEVLGGVKIGHGVTIAEDGTISVDTSIPDDNLVTPEDINSMLDEIFPSE